MDNETQRLIDGVRASFERNGFTHYLAGWDDISLGYIIVTKKCSTIGAATLEVIQVVRDGYPC